MYQNTEDEKQKLSHGNGSGNEYNFNYNGESYSSPAAAVGSNNIGFGGSGSGSASYYNQQSAQQPIYSTTGMPGPSASNAFDNIDISKNKNRFSSGTPFETVHEFVSVNNKKFQNFLDSTTPHTGPRWLIFSFLLLIFILRVVLYQGFYVVAYALGIYLLNIFLLFLSPKFDPAMTEDESGLDNDASLHGDDDGGFLPGNSMGSPLIDEFRPFVRRLPEFKFWYNAITSLICGLFCTLFSVFDIPVFWPILLMYFVTLFALTMRRQIQHMIKYKYLPFDLGKKAYA